MPEQYFLLNTYDFVERRSFSIEIEVCNKEANDKCKPRHVIELFLKYLKFNISYSQQFPILKTGDNLGEDPLRT